MIYALYLILSFAFVLVLCALLLPVSVRVVLNDRRKSISLGWFFVMWRVDLVSKTSELRLFSQRIISRKMEKKPKEKAKKIEKKKKSRKKKKGRGFDVLVLWSEKNLLPKVLSAVVRFLKDVLRGIRFDRFFLEADVATPDPALTGTIYGGLYPICTSINAISPRLSLELRPDFANNTPRGSAEVVLSSRPINTFKATLRMFFALPKIKMIRTILKMKRR